MMLRLQSILAALSFVNGSYLSPASKELSILDNAFLARPTARSRVSGNWDSGPQASMHRVD